MLITLKLGERKHEIEWIRQVTMKKKVEYKEVFPLVDHFIAKERIQDSEIYCETLLETIVDTESEVTELSTESKIWY